MNKTKIYNFVVAFEKSMFTFLILWLGAFAFWAFGLTALKVLPAYYPEIIGHPIVYNSFLTVPILVWAYFLIFRLGEIKEIGE